MKGAIPPPRGSCILLHALFVVQALHKLDDREAFNLTDGEPSTCADFFSLLAERAGVRPPRSLPTPVMKAGAALISRLCELGLTKDEASVDTVRYLMRMDRYSSEKARARLGYVPECRFARAWS